MAECCTCGTTDSHRFLKLNSKKGAKSAVAEEIVNKLFYVLNFDCIKFETICAPCVKKVEAAYRFIERARSVQTSLNNTTTTTTNNTAGRSCSTTAAENSEDRNEDVEVLESEEDYKEVPRLEDHSYSEQVTPDRQISGTSQPPQTVTSTNSHVLHSFMTDVEKACTELCKKNDTKSVLGRLRPVERLAANGENLIPEILEEFSARMPFVYKLFISMTGRDLTESDTVGPSVAMAYATLLHHRSPELSAFQRLTTAICLEGHLNDEGITRLNKFGVTLSPTSKLKLQDECSEVTQSNLVEELRKNPMVKIIGDNLDIYIRTAHERQNKTNTDLHMFASNIIFPRIATPDISNLPPEFHLEEMRPEMLLLHGHYKRHLENAYNVLISKLLLEMPAFDWLRSVSPESHFPYEKQMKRKSKVLPLPILDKNENKLEECIDILDMYEDTLHEAYDRAFGENNRNLEQFKVVVGGDQLTRVRLQEAKNLRNIAVTPKRRFEDLNPFVVEMWHNKQDLLEKAYKRFFDAKSSRQPGTLYHGKAIMRRDSVNGKVKTRFKCHYDLFMVFGKALMKEQLIEFFGMEEEGSIPTKNFDAEIYEGGKRWMSVEEKKTILYSTVSNFLSHMKYLAFDLNNGNSLVNTSDQLYNYCTNYCHWYLQMLEMDDTARHGDITRLVPNCMSAIPFFFSHSRLSKYFVENIDFVFKCEKLLSPLQRMRVLEGSFVNLRGGSESNMEADLMQENSVKVMKNLIKQLGANKTMTAIKRTTAASDTIKSITDGVDKFIQSRKLSTKHKISSMYEEEKTLGTMLRKCRPFKLNQDRKCTGFEKIPVSPFSNIDLDDFKFRINQVVDRLHYGQGIVVDLLENDHSSSEED